MSLLRCPMGVAFWIMPLLCIQYVCVSEYMVCQLNDGSSCPETVCPNTTLNFICNIETQQLGYTVWLLQNETCLDKLLSDKIALLQPKYGGCDPSSSRQHGTCGPFSAQTVATSGCANSSLSLVATQELDGVEIKCMNYNGRNYSLIGNTTLSVVATMPPNLSCMPSCTEIEVQWSMSSLVLDDTEFDNVTVSIKAGTQTVESKYAMTLQYLTFYNLTNDFNYTITLEAVICAERIETSVTVWTLPRPPQNIRGYHTISSTGNVRLLRVTWAPVRSSNNLTYMMQLSSNGNLSISEVVTASDHCGIATCVFTITITNDTSISYFYISMASVSDSRMGPFSDKVRSVEENSDVTFLLYGLLAIPLLLLLLVISVCAAFKQKHPLVLLTGPSRNRSNIYTAEGAQMVMISSLVLTAQNGGLSMCTENTKCTKKDFYNSLYTASKQTSMESTTNATESEQYTVVRAKTEEPPVYSYTKTRTPKLPVSSNGYSTVAQDGFSSSRVALPPKDEKSEVIQQ